MDACTAKKVPPITFHAVLALCTALIVVFVLSCFITTIAEAQMDMEGLAAHGMMSDHDTQKSHDHHGVIAVLGQKEWSGALSLMLISFLFLSHKIFVLFISLTASNWFRFRRRWRRGRLNSFLFRFLRQGILHPKIF
ncbi:MAG: hypothetical protein AAB400_00105 [Patescibacteria group bacterium]